MSKLSIKENPVGKPGDSLIYGLLYCVINNKKIMPARYKDITTKNPVRKITRSQGILKAVHKANVI